MCDYSLQNAKSRPAAVGDKLVTKRFGTGTTGFVDVNDPHINAVFGCVEQPTAICVLPGTEVAFDDNVATGYSYCATPEVIEHKVARFRQINKEHKLMHHDALEFPTPDGKVVLLNLLNEGQKLTVLQLPAAPKTEQERLEQARVEYAG